MTGPTTTPWARRAEELLSDGEWHDGPTLVREIEKLIQPGVAYRRAVTDRERAHQRRQTQGQGAPLSEAARETLIRTGKRAIGLDLVNSRARGAWWTFEPWPLPRTPWQTGAWRVRSVRTRAISLTEASELVGTSPEVLAELLTWDPPIKTTSSGLTGKVRFVTPEDVEVLQGRLVEYWRRRALERLAYGRAKPLQHDGHLTPTQLRERYGISSSTMRSIIEAYPEVGFRIVGETGRVKQLSVTRVAAFEKALVEYLAKSGERRSQQRLTYAGKEIERG